MMRRKTYIWVTGFDSRGVMTTAGPYESEEDAEEATDHLGQTTLHHLHTRQHDKARRILRERVATSGHPRPMPSTDEPEPDPQERSGLRTRIRNMMSGQSKEEREFDDEQ